MASLALSLKENQWELWQHHCQNSATMEGRSQQKLQFMIQKKKSFREQDYEYDYQGHRSE